MDPSLTGQPRAAPSAVLTRATLRAGPDSTEYLRTGRGETVILLLAAGGECALSLQLMEVLSNDCRVIAPTCLATGPGFATILENFFEGLGVENSAIVVEGTFCDEALAFAARSPRISHVAMLIPASDPVDERHAAARDVLAASGARVLTRALPRDTGGIGALGEDLLAFLGGRRRTG